MKYQTQKIAFAYFITAMALFAVQVSLGLIMGWIYVDGTFLSAKALRAWKVENPPTTAQWSGPNR